MRCAVTGGPISVANRRLTRQAQLWPGTGPCCDKEYDRTKLNTYATSMRVSVKNDTARSIIDFFVTAIRKELEAEKVIGCSLKGQAILESRLYLYALRPIAGNAVVGGLGYFVQSQVVFKLGDDLANITHKAAVNSKFPVWKCRVEMSDTLENQCESFFKCFIFWHSNSIRHDNKKPSRATLGRLLQVRVANEAPVQGQTGAVFEQTSFLRKSTMCKHFQKSLLRRHTSRLFSQLACHIFHGK